MRTSTLLLVLVPFVGAVAAAACSGGGGKGGGDTSPTPTPTPTSGAPNSCQIVWRAVDGTDPSLVEVFLVDAPIADWTAGTKTYTLNSPLGIFYNKLNEATKVAQSGAVTTAGTFNLTLGNGTTTGATVGFSDSSNQIFYSLDLNSGVIGAQVATNGTGTFDGVWSDPNPGVGVIGGSGVTHVFFQNTNLTMGSSGSYARCYFNPNFTQSARLAHALDTLLPPR